MSACSSARFNSRTGTNVSTDEVEKQDDLPSISEPIKDRALPEGNPGEVITEPNETENIIRKASAFKGSIIQIITDFITSGDSISEDTIANYKSPAMSVLENIQNEVNQNSADTEFHVLIPDVTERQFTRTDCSAFGPYKIEVIESATGMILQEFNYVCTD